MIYGSRIRLRAPEKTDIPRFVAWLNEPEIRQLVMQRFPISQTREEAWFDEVTRSDPASHPMVIEVRQIGIEDHEQWFPIGNCCLQQIDWIARSTELGIMIGEKIYWNQGYGREAINLLLTHGFNFLNLNRIFLHVLATNQRAIHVYERCGFIHEGKQRQAEYRDGKYLDVLEMSILRDEWQLGSK